MMAETLSWESFSYGSWSWGKILEIFRYNVRRVASPNREGEGCQLLIVDHLNTFHGNSDIAEKGVWCLVWEKGVVGSKIIHQVKDKETLLDGREKRRLCKTSVYMVSVLCFNLIL